MTLFPFFEPLEEKTFLLVGGGHIAKEKLEKLRLFTDRIVVVATETDLNTEEGLGKGILEVRKRPFEEADLEGVDYVIGATNDRAMNRTISELCRERHLPVNIVDDPELCTFIFPSLVKRGDLVVGITTGGKSPAFGQRVRRILEKELPENTEELIEELYRYKQELKQTVPDQRERGKLIQARLRELLEESPLEEEQP